MSQQLFNNPDGYRGAAIVSLPMHQLYNLIRDRLEYAKLDGDPDALCQNICVEVEKQLGTYPNLEHHSRHMDFPTMLAYLKADPERSAKRAHWEWANVAWRPEIGLYRGDMPHSKPGMTLFNEDWVGEDWVACNRSGKIE